MALRDVTAVVFKRGSGPFNEAAALEAYHLVAKMDDESAAEFVYHVTNEIVENTIVENRELVQKHLDSVIAKCLVYGDLDAVSKGLSTAEREVVKKALLSAVSKAETWEEWNAENGAHRRDSAGRFAVDPQLRIQHDKAKELRENGIMDIPKHPAHEEMGQVPGATSKYRAQYAQVAAHLKEHGGFKGVNDVTLHYREGGSQKVKVHKNPNALAEAIRPDQGQNVEAVEVTPYKPILNGKVVDLTRSLGEGSANALNYIGTGQPTAATVNDSPFVRQWYQGHPGNSTQQMYNRIGAGSQLIAQSNLAPQKLKMAAAFGSLVGQHGSQAEAVFGPPIRRMSYRYRGTERRPTRDLANKYFQAVHTAKMSSGDAPKVAADRAPTWQERENGRQAIIQWLQEDGRATNRQLSALQLAAGHTPPSEGVMLNADGQIVTTAVGASDDWYLPFNLKHLSQLKGGEYIRSRSTGGLTTEDIYTGLMSGARRVTVVSRSGIFSVEFDPELRGGRRHNDKAMRMSQRYGELLDAVQSGEVQREPLPAKQQRMIAADIDQEYGRSIPPEERQAKIRERVEEAMKNPASIDSDIAEAQDQWDALAEDRQLTHDEKLARKEQMIRLNEEKEYFWHLNGLGYQGAQDALQEQFPYYIKSMPQRLYANTDALGERDRGYVEPGALRPTAARANLFGGAQGPKGADVPGQQKAFSARTADHAHPLVDRQNQSGGSKAAASETSETRAAGEKKPVDDRTPSEKHALSEQKRKGIAAAMKMRQHLRSIAFQKDGNGYIDAAGFEEGRRYVQMPDYEFMSEMTKDGGLQKFRDTMNLMADAFTHDPDGMPGHADFEAAMGPEIKGDYSYEKAVASPEALFQVNAGREQKKLAAATPLILTNKPAGEASPDELIREKQLIAAVEQAKMIAPDDPSYANVVLQESGLLPQTDHGQKLVMDLVGADGDKARRNRMQSLNIAHAQAEEPKMALGVKPMVQEPEEPEEPKSQGKVYQSREDYLKDHPDERGPNE